MRFNAAREVLRPSRCVEGRRLGRGGDPSLSSLRAGRSIGSHRLGGGIDVVVIELDNDRLFDVLVQKMAVSSNLARMAWLQKEKKKGLDCERNIGHKLRTLREN